MGARNDVIGVQSQSRPALFGVAELDNVLACGGVAPGALHVIEPACRDYATSTQACASGGRVGAIRSANGAGYGHGDVLDKPRKDAAAAMAFALGFGARSGAPFCWLGPPRDLLTPCDVPDANAVADLRIFEEPWRARVALRQSDFASADVRVIILDVRRAERLASPLRLARKLAKQGFVALLLTMDAERLMARPDSGAGALTARWRVGQAWLAPEDGPDDGPEACDCWQIALMRADAVRRVVVRACDSAGRMTAAPRNTEAQTGKEMMRRFASA